MNDFNDRIGNCKPFCGLIAPLVSFIVIANILKHFLMLKPELNIVHFSLLSFFSFITVIFIFSLIFNNGRVSSFFYFDNFEYGKTKKNIVILILTFIASFWFVLS